jgi:DNA-directed RNA polymerase sigma subunit (sigma70/sigma32)
MGDTISAVTMLSMMEDASEEAMEDALLDLETGCMYLDISGLPKVGGAGEAALRLRREQSLVKKGLDPKDLDENDPLRLYLQELAQTPAAGDVQLLAQRYSEGEHHLAQQLVTLCLSQVVELAMEHTGHGVLLLDLIQEGSLGLWQSILCYEDGDFQTHCRWWIRQYMAKAVFLQARSGGIGQKLRQDMEDYRDADQRLLVELGRNPTPEEIAKMLHISPEECALLEKMVEKAMQNGLRILGLLQLLVKKLMEKINSFCILQIAETELV